MTQLFLTPQRLNLILFIQQKIILVIGWEIFKCCLIPLYLWDKKLVDATQPQFVDYYITINGKLHKLYFNFVWIFIPVIKLLKFTYLSLTFWVLQKGHPGVSWCRLTLIATLLFTSSPFDSKLPNSPCHSYSHQKKHGRLVLI